MGGWFVIMAAVDEHAGMLQAPEGRSALEDLLRTSLHQRNAAVAGWVVLPSHWRPAGRG